MSRPARWTPTTEVNDINVNQIIDAIGDLDQLTTPDKSNLVNAIKSGVGTGYSEVTHVLSSYDSLQDAITQIGSTLANLLIDRSETITNNLTIPENINIKGKVGNILTIPDGVTLTINSYITNGLWQLFDCQGTGRVNGDLKNTEIYPEWFGAKGDGVADDYDAIQKCLDAFKRADLSRNTYKIRQPILLKSGYQLRGNGVNTVIWNDGTYTGYSLGKQCILIGNMKGDPSAFTDLASRGSGVAYTTTSNTSSKVGDYSIAVTDASIFEVGDLVWLYSQNTGVSIMSGTKYIPKYQQINKIKSVNTATNTIELEQPIYEDISDTLIVAKNTGSDDYFLSENVIVENIKFKSDLDTWYRLGGAYKCHLRNIWAECDGSGIIFNGFAYSTLENLFVFAKRSNIDLGHFTHHSTFKSCIVSSYRTSPTTHIVGIYEGTHNNKFEDCIFQSNGNNSVDDGYHGIYIFNANANFKNCSFLFGTVTRLIKVKNQDVNVEFDKTIFKDCKIHSKECNYGITGDNCDYILKNCEIKTNPLINLVLYENTVDTPNIVADNLIIDVPQKSTFAGFSAIRNKEHNCRWSAIYKNHTPDRENIYTAKQHMSCVVKKYGSQRSIARIRGTSYTTNTETTILKQYFSPNEITDEDILEIYVGGVTNGTTSTKTVKIYIYTPANSANPEYTESFTIGSINNQKFMYKAVGGVTDIGGQYWRLKYEAYDNNGFRIKHAIPNVDTSQGFIVEIKVKVDTPATGEEIIPDVTYMKIQNW